MSDGAFPVHHASAPTTPQRSKRVSEECPGPAPKVRALRDLRDNETPLGFRVASSGNVIPASMRTSSHSAGRDYMVDERASEMSFDFDFDAVPRSPPCDDSHVEEDQRKVARRERRAARARLNCYGCCLGVSNQEGHAYAGGCMDPDASSVDSDMSSEGGSGSPGTGGSSMLAS